MFLRQIVGQSEDKAPPGPGDDFWYGGIGMTSSGIRLTPYSIMKISAVYACVMLVAETIASLPLKMYERKQQDILPYPQHPLQDVIDLKPNANQTAYEYWLYNVAAGCLFGHSYSLIKPGLRGAVTELEPLRPDFMRIYKVDSGGLRFEYTDPTTHRRTVYLPDEIFRIPGFSFNGIDGIAPIVFANDPAGLSAAAEMFGSKFFKQDATPSIALEYPKTLDEPEIDRIRKSWRAGFGGLQNAFGVAVLENGMQVKTLGSPNKDAQFLETRKFQIAEIARYFRIPPHMIGELEKSTNNNIEQQSIEFVKYTIRPWVRKITQRINTDLISNSQRFFADYVLDDLLAGEMKPRYEAYQLGETAGWLMRNEIRKKEKLNPKDGLDEPRNPLNMTSGDGGSAGGDNKANDNPKPKGANLYPVIGDAFQRIIAKEVADVKALVKKHSATLLARVPDFYAGKHKPYIIKTLTPVYQLCTGLGVAASEPDAWAEKYTASRIETISAMVAAGDNIETWLDSWAGGRAQLMAVGYLEAQEAINGKETTN